MSELIIREVNINYGKAQTYSTIKSVDGVVEFLRQVAPNNSQEHVIALYLDGKHSPIGYSVVSTGTANSCPVHPREVFQRAVMLGACAVILAHNHPSGDVARSAEDDRVTAKIGQAGDVLGIKLLDHVIFSDTDCYSYEYAGKLKELVKA
jgi:DNA repair protein RadC